jgi:hypothetical protein
MPSNIPGLATTESNYLMSPEVGDGNHNDQLKQINDQVDKLAGIMNGNPSIITKQQEMSKIVNDESKRLETKQQSIASAVTSQNRLITLNENYSKRFTEYIKMIVALAVGLAIIAILIIIKVPSGLITMSAIIIGSLVLIYCTYVYADISSRDNIYFDELNMNSFSLPANAATRDSSGNIINLLDTLNPLSCFGSSCCAVGTIWDATSQLCQKIPETFQNSKSLKVAGDEKPWLPNEYDAYAKI